MVKLQTSSTRIAPGVQLDRDVMVPLRDGVRMAANVFTPTASGRFPAILSVTPCAKDNLQDRLGTLMMRLSGVRFGTLNCSRWAGFESPDPHYWVNRGYIVAQADARGMHKSEGAGGVLRDDDAADNAEFIAWTATQPWCDGAVGLLGVSYLAMSQWRVAALRPLALRAICPWEGVSDLLREFVRQDGVPETSFVPVWWKNRIVRGANRRVPPSENSLAGIDRHPLDDDYWASKRPALAQIEVPALICASWSDHGLHTRGSVLGFETIASQHKWLFTHGRKKWETFYSEEAVALQTRSFDRFLKGVENGMEKVPEVRLERRRAFYQADVRTEPAWPLDNLRPTPLHLSASQRLTLDASTAEAVATYDSNGNGNSDRASFSYSFDRDTEFTGGMCLTLFVSSPESDDLDLFVTIHKLDKDGREVFFSGFNGYIKDCVAKGWLRVSHRELDPVRSTVLRPFHSHRLAKPTTQRDAETSRAFGGELEPPPRCGHRKARDLRNDSPT